MSNTFDLVVIGAGPGGYVAAIRAAQLGQKVAIVEREHLGGICLNWGCIPTKALLRSAEIFHHMRHASSYGLAADNVRFDLSKIVERSRGVAKQLNGGIGHLLKKNKVTVIDGSAKLQKDKSILVTAKDGKSSILTAKNIILATGARARELPHLQADGELVWTYKHAMTPKEMPKSMIIIGSGAIGIEFASFYRTLGADVTVVEMMDRILPVEDEEISALARKSFEKQGMKILTQTQVEKLEKGKGSVTVHLKNAKGDITQQTVERVIMAIGIVGNTENLGLEEVGVKTDRGHVVVNQWCETDVAGIYAIGDLVAGPWLAHKASHEGVIVAERIAGKKDVHPLDKSNIPGCTYCHPQIASVGLTEAKAKSAGYEIKVGRFPFMANGKAIALGESEGIIKTIFDAKTGALLGAHMIGAEVTEMIQGYVVARTLETTEAELMHTVFPHPTLSEMMHESVLDAYGQAIHF
jgi:dihydrolipoamide dehydrogenase